MKRKEKHAAYYLKFELLNIPSGGTSKDKRPTHMAETNATNWLRSVTSLLSDGNNYPIKDNLSKYHIFVTPYVDMVVDKSVEK